MATVSAVIFMVSTVQAATPVDFIPFKGNYTGSWQLSVEGGLITSAVSIRVKVPKNGNTMTMSINGVLNIDGFDQNLPLATTLKFTQKRKLTSDAFLMGYLGSTATLPSKYRYRGKKKLFIFSQVAAPGAKVGVFPIAGTTSYSLKFSKKTLTILGSGNPVSGGSPTPIVIQIRAKKAGR